MILTIAASVVGFICVSTIVAVATHNGTAAFFPAVVGAIWAGWPFSHRYGVEQCNLLHPAPKQYKVDVQQAFTAVRDILRESSYNFGDTWHVKTADTTKNRIVADLKYTEEETLPTVDTRTVLAPRTKRVERWIRFEAQFKSMASETVMQVDFQRKVEGLNQGAADPIISGLATAVDTALGGGAEIGQPISMRLPEPPKWLLGLTAIMLFFLFFDVVKAVYGY